MSTEILEPVEMVSWSRGAGLVPCRFRWRGRVYRISRVNASWESREGSVRQFHFMVRTSSGDTCELHFDAGDMRWMLDYVHSDP